MTKASILVVEDQIIEQKLLSLLAQKYGYDVQIVSSSEEAINELESGKLFSLILMDWKLPGESGLDCTKKIREFERDRGYHTPIVAITGRAMDGDKKKCLGAGMDDYMSKPFSAEEFKQMLIRWIPDQNSPISFH